MKDTAGGRSDRAGRPGVYCIAFLATIGAGGAWSQPPEPTPSPAYDGIAAHIPPGRWEFAYRRLGEFKPLHWKHREEGRSSACIEGDAHRYLLDWIARKGCSVNGEREVPGGYLLSGECRLKWLPGQAVPVDVRLSWGSGRGFEMEIRTREGALLDFTEHTLATHLGACAPP